MYNDLIFPILPRNTKVPVEGDNRIQRIRKAVKSESLNQDEKEQHDQTHRVDEAERQDRHKRVEGVYKEPQQERQASEHGDAQQATTDANEKKPKTNDEKPDDTTTAATPVGRKHLDVYI